MFEGECVYLLCLRWQPCASPHFQAIFHPTAAVHTAEGDKHGGVVGWGLGLGLGGGGCWCHG